MKKLWVLLMTVLVLSGFQQMQERMITGKVTSTEDGTPLPGVNVTLKGTSVATSSDANGDYSINVPATGATLVFSFVGLKSQEITVAENRVINVSMEQEVTQLSEAVITGYATKAQRNVVGASVSTISRSRRPKYKLSSEHETIEVPLNTEDYEGIQENIFHDAVSTPLSTFSIDVDAASYTNVRRFINSGQRPPKDAVRIEEMINYFDYNFEGPEDEHPFAIHTEVSSAPWNPKHKLVQIGLQGKKIDTKELPASNLVFLIDVSGSMSDPNKLPLVITSLEMLVEQLREKDRVSIVVYAGAAGVVLEATSGNEKKKILHALNEFQAGGSTAGGKGIELAYALAKDNFRKNGNNRVILCTDGDFNVGASSNEAMEN